MSKYLKIADNSEVLYEGRWINKIHFRVFVYNEQGEKKLASSYEQYASLIESGEWFSSKEDIKPKEEVKNPINIKTGRKQKNGTDS